MQLRGCDASVSTSPSSRVGVRLPLPLAYGPNCRASAQCCSEFCHHGADIYHSNVPSGTASTVGLSLARRRRLWNSFDRATGNYMLRNYSGELEELLKNQGKHRKPGGSSRIESWRSNFESERSGRGSSAPSRGARRDREGWKPVPILHRTVIPLKK